MRTRQKFADTYAEMIKRKKNGEMVMGLEEKKKKIPPYDSPLSGSRSKGNLLPPAFGISKRKNVYFLEDDTFESRDRHRYGICDARDSTGKRDSSDFSAWNSGIYDSDLQRISWKVGD